MALEVIKTEEVGIVVATAPQVLQRNELLLSKALTISEVLINRVNEGGMDDDLDMQINDWQVRAKKVLNTMMEGRAPITQMFDAVKKKFTEIEGKIDPKKVDSDYTKLQNIRNAWATKKAEEQKARELEIQHQQSIKREKIELKALAEAGIRKIYHDKLAAFKNYLLNTYNELTLENKQAIQTKIERVSVNYPGEKFNEIYPNISANFVDVDTVNEIIVEVRADLYDELAAHFYEVMEVEKQRYIDIIPSRILELKEISLANEEKRKEMEQQAQKRQLEEEKRIQEEKEAAKKTETERIANQSEMQKAELLFETASETAAVI